MFRVRIWLSVSILLLSNSQAMWTQQATPNAIVPPLVRFSGTLTDGNGTALMGIVGVTFFLYQNSQGGTPLWMETQNVQPDKAGHYSVMLGSSTSHGLPVELFVSGEARWVGVQPQGQAEQPRVLLLSVPYALKAADAATVGGLPPAAFVLATPPSSAAAAPSSSGLNINPNALPLGGSGTTNYIPIWTNSTTLGNSLIFQTGGKIGIANTHPAGTLDVSGGAFIRGTLQLPATGTATAKQGFISQPLDALASAFNSSTRAAVNQHFRWQAEPVGNDTPTPSGKFNLLFASGNSNPAETGLSINSKGLITFAAGQQFTGTRTITGVTAGTDLTGGGRSGNVTLNLDTTALQSQNDARYARLGSGNSFTGNQSVSGNLSASGSVSGGSASFSGNVSSGGSVTARGLVSKNGAVFSGSGLVVSILENGSSGEGLLATSSNITGGEAAIHAEANGATGVTFGVLGNNASSTNFAAGALGQDLATSGITFGVEGFSNSSSFGSAGVGVFGLNSVASNTALSRLGLYPEGVWGDTGVFGGLGVVATADDGIALFAENNSTSGFETGQFFNQQTSRHNIGVLDAGGSFGECIVDTDGNLSCTGTKSAVVPIDDGQRQVALYAVEAPQNWFEDFGSGQLSGGSAIIRLDLTFAQTVNPDTEYHVFLTPEGDCEGLYLAHKTPTSFEVQELRGGRSNIAFDYRIVALRKGYEQVRLADKTEEWKQLREQRAKPRATAGAGLPLPAPRRLPAPLLNRPATAPPLKPNIIPPANPSTHG